MPLRCALLLAFLPAFALSLCPFIGRGGAPLPAGHPAVGHDHAHARAGGGHHGARAAAAAAPEGYAEALAALPLDAVKKDLKALFLDSQDWWPADYGNYGPFFVRLAWHCSGSYRTSDGRGGCDGGRQRFDPERSWPDNTNLDKARKLLWPIKEKYGLGLSWGDLFILAGTTAIESMGGPVLGFCAGRVDDQDGYWSQELGPTALQEEYAPCAVNGKCDRPLGSTTVGLIYLNPQGPMGEPVPHASALEVRDTFARMAMNDSETVALIGGGHAFGKTHGACPKGPGPDPDQDPMHPWPGACGTGKGADAFTSGIEGPWTTDPTHFDNVYFKELVGNDWVVHKGPGGAWQWRVNGTSPTAPSVDGRGRQDIQMMTSDVSLLHDPEGKYQPIVKKFAEDEDAFARAFSHAWYKLTTRDMGPVTRCVGPDVPPAQPFQYPLPPQQGMANFTQVYQDVKAALGPDTSGNGPLLVRLAWSSASTFRFTDFLGGANGARIRFSPEKDWPANAGLDQALALLKPIMAKHKYLSWSDLIVMAGSVALEVAGAAPLSFCSGRTDALDGAGSSYLGTNTLANLTGSTAETVAELKGAIKISGLSLREFVALMGGHSIGKMHAARSGYSGSWTADPTVLDNSYYKALLNEEWEPYTCCWPTRTGKPQYKAKGKELFALKVDMMLVYDPELSVAAHEFAADEKLWQTEFAAAWTKIMVQDRFDGPTGNVCP